MEEQLAVLTTTAANTVVSSLSTDAWARVRELIVGVWRRHRPDEESAAASATDAALDVLRGSPSDEEESRLVEAWQERFRALLDAEPAARRALTALVDELAAEQAGQAEQGERGEQGDAPAQRIDMHAEAKDGGTVYQAGRDMHVKPT
ncbi:MULTISPECIES: hypothetical protein [unclassified Streptomyces]|uniref:hypothetical protein n=1 Tax=unclassified Streptomyces TaxID=2593676 RepID=UPI00236652CB|nr:MULTISPECIES: hypothetical protein [unclassified Streptomyces]MDF3141686.1 hypothetical protein [Streptomyces sp. T21Q-yed]WDF40951.1 hypothetical protein PBV52_31315 [Streptomyces sp. T12]